MIEDGLKPHQVKLVQALLRFVKLFPNFKHVKKISELLDGKFFYTLLTMVPQFPKMTNLSSFRANQTNILFLEELFKNMVIYFQRISVPINQIYFRVNFKQFEQNNSKQFSNLIAYISFFIATLCTHQNTRQILAQNVKLLNQEDTFFMQNLIKKSIEQIDLNQYCGLDSSQQKFQSERKNIGSQNQSSKKKNYNYSVQSSNKKSNPNQSRKKYFNKNFSNQKLRNDMIRDMQILEDQNYQFKEVIRNLQAQLKEAQQSEQFYKTKNIQNQKNIENLTQICQKYEDKNYTDKYQQMRNQSEKKKVQMTKQHLKKQIRSLQTQLGLKQKIISDHQAYIKQTNSIRQINQQLKQQVQLLKQELKIISQKIIKFQNDSRSKANQLLQTYKKINQLEQLNHKINLQKQSLIQKLQNIPKITYITQFENQDQYRNRQNLANQLNDNYHSYNFNKQIEGLGEFIQSQMGTPSKLYDIQAISQKSIEQSQIINSGRRFQQRYHKNSNNSKTITPIKYLSPGKFAQYSNSNNKYKKSPQKNVSQFVNSLKQKYNQHHSKSCHGSKQKQNISSIKKSLNKQFNNQNNINSINSKSKYLTQYQQRQYQLEQHIKQLQQTIKIYQQKQIQMKIVLQSLLQVDSQNAKLQKLIKQKDQQLRKSKKSAVDTDDQERENNGRENRFKLIVKQMLSSDFQILTACKDNDPWWEDD